MTPTTKQLTHAEGVERCEKIARHEGCPVGWCDPMQQWARGERADWLSIWTRAHDPGWESRWTGGPVEVYAGDQLLLDFKTSKGDKWADERKRWRKAARALGTHRGYVCPEGVIEPHEVDDTFGWGLWWLIGESFRCMKPPERQRNCDWGGTLALVATLLQREQHAPSGRSSRNESGQQAKLTKQQHAEVRNQLANHGQMFSKELARLIDAKPQRITHDAEAGLIEGVRCEGTPAMLWLEGERVFNVQES